MHDMLLVGYTGVVGSVTGCCWLYRCSRLCDMLIYYSDRQLAPEDPVVLDLWSLEHAAGRHPELSSHV